MACEARLDDCDRRGATRDLARVISLLERIADALDPPEAETDERPTPTCPCARRSGQPVANCPLCRGTGERY